MRPSRPRIRKLLSRDYLANRDGIPKLKIMIRITTIFAALAISACSGTPTAAPEQSAGTETSSESVTLDELRAEMYEEEEIVCRFESTVGSRLGKRVCRTKSQREAERIAGQEALERNARIYDIDNKEVGE